jgi:hypothetical protein
MPTSWGELDVSPVDGHGSAVDESAREADRRCPYLATVFADGRLGPASREPDDANRCAALAHPMPQSTRQQARVCLTDAHLDCPRYRLGVILRRSGADPEAVTLSGPRVTPTSAAPTAASGARARPAPSPAESTVLTPAVLAATALLVLSAVASLAFVLIRGGLTLK